MNNDNAVFEQHVSTGAKWAAIESFCHDCALPAPTIRPGLGDDRVDVDIEDHITCNNSPMAEALDKIIVWSHGYVLGYQNAQKNLTT